MDVQTVEVGQGQEGEVGESGELVLVQGEPLQRAKACSRDLLYSV